MEATTSGNDQSSIVQVLFEFKESRRPLSIPRDALLQRVERELALCVGDACLLPPGMNLSDVASSSKNSSDGHKNGMLLLMLQVWKM